MGNRNAILDPKTDRVGRGARGLGRCEISLIDLMARHDLVDKFRLDHPGREMWTWLDSSPSVYAISYLDSVRTADTDFFTCPTFHFVGKTNHRLVRVSLRLVNRPSLSGYWKFNTSLVEIWDFYGRLESLIQRRDRWWGSLKHRIIDFTIKYGRHLNLDRTKMVTSF